MGQMPIMGKNKVKYLAFVLDTITWDDSVLWTNIAIAAVDTTGGVQFQSGQGVHLY
jgi:hypothetical protein